MSQTNEMTLAEIERCHPEQWVLMEETAWDAQGHPLRGIVRAYGKHRGNVSRSLRELHKRSKVKTFVFYTGDKIPEHLSVIL